MYAIINGKIIDGSNLLKDKAIIIENNLIVKIIPIKEIPSSIEKLDVEGSYITPGFIDLQLNGCGGVLFNDSITKETIQAMLDTNLKSGCTSFLPTLISASKEDIVQALNVTTEMYNLKPNNILGIHLEGPFINKQKKGIHNEKHIRSISEAEVNILRNGVKSLPIVLTLAPEVNDLGLISSLLDSGVKVTLGHSNATYEEAMEAIDLGVNNATHLFNAMSELNHRSPGLVSAILNNPSVSTGIIVDGMHVDFNLVKLVKKIKQENIYIVTDAAPPAGAPEIEKFKFGGHDMVVVNGKALNKNGTLGGSIITMIESVYNAAEILGFGIIEAVRMVSLYPARVLGCHNKVGLIKNGYIANLAIFDCNYKMHYTINNGEIIKLF